MAKTTINLKADHEVKRQAQRVAGELGMPLSTVVNAYLKQFIRTREVHFFVEGRIKPDAARRLNRREKEARAGKNLSPAFESGKDAIRYLRSK